MLIHRLPVGRQAGEYVAHAPAKLNLFFEVLARRSDGYHEIETLMCPIDLYDTLYFQEVSSGQLELRCERGFGSLASVGIEPTDLEPTDLPEGRENLVYRAVELLRQRAGVSSGARLRLVKRIPTAAGLGGGSSDAAAALVLANLGWNLQWSVDRLAQLAAELGSDVPFFLVNGPAICRGRGERIEPISHLGMLHFVVVRPPAGLSTPAVYGVCQPAEHPHSLAPLQSAVKAGNLEGVGRSLWNRLQPAASSLSPWIEYLQREFDREDVLGHRMSGSGTSYFGLCRHAIHARRVARRLGANGVGSVFAVRNCR